jgi:hypothetical protein
VQVQTDDHRQRQQYALPSDVRRTNACRYHYATDAHPSVTDRDWISLSGQVDGTVVDVARTVVGGVVVDGVK